MKDKLNQIDVRRSMGLMSVGALTGLLLAGYALFTARGTSTLRVPPEDVALVNQQPISRSDYLLELQTLYSVDFSQATPEQRQKVLNDMIREELLVQRGKELDVSATDSEVRAALVNAVELEIAANALTAQPSTAALNKYYLDHQSKYSSEGIMTVHDYVFGAGSQQAASAAANSMSAGPPTAAALAGWGAVESKKVGDEQFYFAAQIHLGDALFDVARSLSTASASAPVKMPDGIHVLFMSKNQKPVPLAFAAARDQVLNDYRNDSIKQVTKGDEGFLRKRANVLIADDLQ